MFSVNVMLHGQVRTVDLPAEYIDECWETAHQTILDLSERKIRQFASLGYRYPAAFISGGSSRNATLRTRVKNMCTDAGIHNVLMVSDVVTANEL